ncbi:MAG TPA: hypothetical protein EYP08_00785 [Pyrodictiaceae archaeon]|nr:hypothetical protein [Pyrodictiaceae archaeon]HIQ55269.1 hypothetical protein [Pyrodictium sp.]
MGKRLLVPISEDVILELEKVAEREGIPLRILVERLLRASLMVLEHGWRSDTLFLLEALRSIGASPVPLLLLDQLGGGNIEECIGKARSAGREVAEAVLQLVMIGDGGNRDSIEKIELLDSIARYVNPQTRPLRRQCTLIVPLTSLGEVAKAYVSGFMEVFGAKFGCRVRVSKLSIILDCCQS